MPALPLPLHGGASRPVTKHRDASRPLSVPACSAAAPPCQVYDARALRVVVDDEGGRWANP